MVKTLPFFQALETLDLPALERNLFSSPSWLRVLDRTYHPRLFVKYIERDGRVASYVMYSVVKNFLEWKICICSYCDYCDAYVQTAEDWRQIMASLREEFPRYRVAVRNLRDLAAREVPELKELSRERHHVLDIRDAIDEVWRRAHDSFKSAVRQSEKAGVTVRPCSRESLRDFYAMHLQVRKYKYQIFPQPFRFFEQIWDEYMAQDRGVLLGAYDPQGRLIGGNMYLICGDTLYYKINTSARGGLGLRPNNLLFWEGIKLAKARGLHFIDLGSSGYDQKGLILFKNHTGAVCQDIVHLGYHPPDYQFSEKRILRVFTRLFTLPFLPDRVTEWGSSIIYPYLA